MDPWQEFYQAVRDPSWPECDREQDFDLLPDWIQRECRQHGYVPRQYFQQFPLPSTRFPVDSPTGCKLKWNWSTLYLNSGTTASCHRTDGHQFDLDQFDFHNTPEKINDREQMLKGLWPRRGCENCKRIEQAGGQSDRITSSQMTGLYHPPELDQDPKATQVTPRMLEVYFDNTCNLKCVYCGPQFSSMWEAELRRHGSYEKDGLVIYDRLPVKQDTVRARSRLFEWIAKHGQHLTHFNILGGEPLYQTAFDECLEFFDQHPCPMMELQIFTNLNCTPKRLADTVTKIKRHIDQGKLRAFTVTASLDCWGPEQEYARYPLSLKDWQPNFEYLLQQDWIKLVIGSTLTVLTVGTLSDLVDRINQWNRTRPVYHYFNEVDNPTYLMVDILGDALMDDFNRALELVPNTTPEEINTRRYLEGIAKQSQSKGVNPAEMRKMVAFLDELDRRRGTDWRTVFPKIWKIVAKIG